MSKYKEALERLVEETTNDYKNDEDFNTIQELIDLIEEYDVKPEELREVLLTGKILKYKPTLEEVKREWEEKDYIWDETDYDIKIISKIPTYFLKIRLFKKDKFYQGIVDLKEHQLLNKTLKALGWLDE